MESLAKLSKPIICSTPFENEMIKWGKLFFSENGISKVSNEKMVWAANALKEKQMN